MMFNTRRRLKIKVEEDEDGNKIAPAEKENGTKASQPKIAIPKD
jgi:hypothetical protein